MADTFVERGYKALDFGLRSINGTGPSPLHRLLRGVASQNEYECGEYPPGAGLVL